MTETPTKSLAAVVTGFNEPLQVRELPVPELAPGSVLVKIELATVCGSDVHLWDGSRSQLAIKFPMIPGHEMTGRVVAFGDGPHIDSAGTTLDIGDRLIWTIASCGSCFNCTVLELPNLCRSRETNVNVGAENPPYLLGGFSEYAYVLPKSKRFRVPDGVKSEWASAASCALRSVVRGFERLGRSEPWETIVIQGAGPLGLFATAYAQHSGAGRIIVIGGPADRLALARDWGATETVAISDYPDAEGRIAAVRQLTGGDGAEIVMEFSGAGSAFAEGVEMVRPGGRYVVSGQVVPHPVPVAASRITTGHLTILGAYSGGGSHYWRALQFLDLTRDKYDFDRLISGRFHLDQATDALKGMQSYTEIKPVILPTLSNG